MLAASTFTHAALAPAGLRTEWLVNPLGLDAEKPRLSWRVEESDAAVRGQRQTKYHVLVSTNPMWLMKGTGEIWDSGVVESDQTLNIEYAGNPLESGKAYYWRVYVWDKDGVKSGSAGAHWAMAVILLAVVVFIMLFVWFGDGLFEECRRAKRFVLMVEICG